MQPATRLKVARETAGRSGPGGGIARRSRQGTLDVARASRVTRRPRAAPRKNAPTRSFPLRLPHGVRASRRRPGTRCLRRANRRHTRAAGRRGAESCRSGSGRAGRRRAAARERRRERRGSRRGGRARRGGGFRGLRRHGREPRERPGGRRRGGPLHRGPERSGSVGALEVGAADPGLNLHRLRRRGPPDQRRAVPRWRLVDRGLARADLGNEGDGRLHHRRHPAGEGAVPGRAAAPGEPNQRAGGRLPPAAQEPPERAGRGPRVLLPDGGAHPDAGAREVHRRAEDVGPAQGAGGGGRRAVRARRQARAEGALRLRALRWRGQGLAGLAAPRAAGAGDARAPPPRSLPRALLQCPRAGAGAEGDAASGDAAGPEPAHPPRPPRRHARRNRRPLRGTRWRRSAPGTASAAPCSGSRRCCRCRCAARAPSARCRRR